MNTAATPEVDAGHAPAAVKTALAILEKDPRWLTASEQERAVLKRIAMQRDRLAAARQAKAQAQAQSLHGQPDAVPADAPLVERVVVFAKLHPVATAALAGLALMIGPRKLLRYGSIALPLLAKIKR